jgi:O-acetyl-ADP-ribose deacetylase
MAAAIGPPECMLCARAKIGSTEMRIYQGSVLELYRNDAQVVVNPANNGLQHGGGLAGAIATQAGPELVRESEEIMRKNRRPLRNAEAVVTTAGNLKFTKVVHVVGPIVQQHNPPSKFQMEELENSVFNAIVKAGEVEHADCVAIPGISCGSFGFPKKEAADCHLKAFIRYAKDRRPKRIIKVYFSLYAPDEAASFVDDFLSKMEVFTFDEAEFFGTLEQQTNCMNKTCGGCGNYYKRDERFRIGKCHDIYCDFCIYRYQMKNCLSCKSSLGVPSENSLDQCDSKEYFIPDAVYCRICLAVKRISPGCCTDCFNICSEHSIPSRAGQFVCPYCEKPITSFNPTL